MEIILPCAGKSTRFPQMRPKYLLTDYQGKVMIEHVVRPYIHCDARINIIILAEHDQKYHVSAMLNHLFDGKVNLVTLDSVTKGPAETVYNGINHLSLDYNTPMLIRDCDSFFSHSELRQSNKLYVAKLSDYPTVRNAASKSYVVANDQLLASTIVEKQIVSDLFCVGGYQFEQAGKFCDAYESLNLKGKEPFVSDCIEFLLGNGNVFEIEMIKDWIDVGTAEDWQDYNNKPTIFCDIDGTIIVNQSHYGTNNYYSQIQPLPNSVGTLIKAQEKGCQLIFTTARNAIFKDRTQEILNSLGFKDYQLIMGLHHSRRILINDYAPSNPYPSSISINLKRDQDTLADQLEPFLK